MYAETTVLHTSKLGPIFDITGIQGCVLSSTLFLVVLGVKSRRNVTQMRQMASNGVSMNDFMIWTTPMTSFFFHIHTNRIQRKKIPIKQHDEEVGLKINIKKTKSMGMGVPKSSGVTRIFVRGEFGEFKGGRRSKWKLNELHSFDDLRYTIICIKLYDRRSSR